MVVMSLIILVYAKLAMLHVRLAMDQPRKIVFSVHQDMFSMEHIVFCVRIVTAMNVGQQSV